MTCRAALIVSNGVTADAGRGAAQDRPARGRAAAGPQQPGLPAPASSTSTRAPPGPLARAGSLGVVCQSGALTAAMLDWARSNGVGFSLVASIGPHTDVDIAQVLDYLANDPQTQCIIVYLEGIGSARRFMSALRSAAIAKPVVVLKAGRKLAGNEAAQTHSAATVGSRRGVRRRAAPRRRGARALVRGAVLGGQVPGLALPAGGAAAGAGHQRRRPGRAGGRLGQRDRAEAGQAVGAVHRGAQAAAAGRGVDLRPDRRVRGRDARALRRGDPRRGGRQGRRRHPRDPFAQGRRRPDRRRQGRGGAAAHHLQAAALVLDGRRHDGRGARAAQRRRHRQLPHARGRGGRVRQHQHLLPEPAPAAADAAAAVHARQARHRGRAAADRERAGRAPQGAHRDGVEDAAVVVPRARDADHPRALAPPRR